METVANLNYQGFMGDIPLDFEYTRWGELWGAEIGDFRFQVGVMNTTGGIVDPLIPFDHQMSRHPQANVINLLEVLDTGYFRWWGCYYTAPSALQALKSLLAFRSYENETS